MHHTHVLTKPKHTHTQPTQAVCYRDHLYVFGGEFGTSDQFYHYRDFWRCVFFSLFGTMFFFKCLVLLLVVIW
jgi:uncharacterized membrane protein